jgi:hypothetical protein
LSIVRVDYLGENNSIMFRFNKFSTTAIKNNLTIVVT